MKAYDVTGVGLNLGSADEFARKARAAQPAGLLPVPAACPSVRTSLVQIVVPKSPSLPLCRRWGCHFRRGGRVLPMASGSLASSRRAPALSPKPLNLFRRPLQTAQRGSC